MEGEIIFNIDVMLAKRKMSVTELSQRVGITMANISILKNGKAKAIKVSTLAKLCEALDLSRGLGDVYKRQIISYWRAPSWAYKQQRIMGGN